jgi:hypothetical protein
MAMRPSRRLLLLALLCAAGGAGAQAQPRTPLSPAETRQVRVLIESQLQAFAADDADRAFSFASDELRRLFGSAENFVAMVRSSYPVVYRPASVRFLLPERADRQVLQAVQMTDGTGKAWLALYRVQRLADRSWRIAGCQLVENDGRST